jgi:hypothetical protein
LAYASEKQAIQGFGQNIRGDRPNISLERWQDIGESFLRQI